MKAEKTRKFIERNISIDKALGIKSGEHLYGLKAELDEVERLAEIGRATEKLFEHEGFVSVDVLADPSDDESCITANLLSKEDLLDWANGGRE